MRNLEVVPLGAQATLDDAFARSLRSCYRAHGVDVAAKALPASQREHVHLVVVRDRDGSLLGGARVHAHRGIAGFPAEAALSAFPEAHRRFAALANDDSAELAAMWTAPAGKRTGIARLLAQASIACAMALHKRFALTFSHQHFEHVLFPIGMRPIRGVAPVAFPTTAYRSRVYVADLASLVTATSTDRKIIGEMVSCFREGASSLSIERLAGIEHGRPNLTIRSNGAPQRAAS